MCSKLYVNVRNFSWGIVIIVGVNMKQLYVCTPKFCISVSETIRYTYFVRQK